METFSVLGLLLFELSIVVCESGRILFFAEPFRLVSHDDAVELFSELTWSAAWARKLFCLLILRLACGAMDSCVITFREGCIVVETAFDGSGDFLF